MTSNTWALIRSISYGAFASILVAVASLSMAGAKQGKSNTSPGNIKKHGQVTLTRNVAAPMVTGYSAAQDFGNVALIVDDGLMVIKRHIPDLNDVQIQFVPNGGSSFSVSHGAANLEPDYGPALTFGQPGTQFPGDDDAQEVAFPAGFPFFGTTYNSVWVNTDGNVTFGAPEYASDSRDKMKHSFGPPRVSAWLADWLPNNALNPSGQGTIHAVAKTGPDRLVITWNGVTAFGLGGTSTFQIVLFSTGTVQIKIANIDSLVNYGTVGLAQGGGKGPYTNADFKNFTGNLSGGAIMDAFSQYAYVNNTAVAREFYAAHPDKFDFLAMFTDFSTDDFIHSEWVSSQVHGIGAPLDPANGEAATPSIRDFTAAAGSAGELEQTMMYNNIFYWATGDAILNPQIKQYGPGANIVDYPERFGWPTTLDGQVIQQYRMFGTLPPDDGELSRHYPHGGPFANWIMSNMAILTHEVGHRWGSNLRFVHPTKGIGFDSYDLLGRDIQHWSYFFNTPAMPGMFSAPTNSCMEGNYIQDLGTIASYNGQPTNLATGEHVFKVPEAELCDGYSALDLYTMGLRRDSEVGPMWYVDEPSSIYTNQSLDEFHDGDPLNTSYTMRGWAARGGVVFKGKRVDLTLQNIMDFEKEREGKDNPQGKRFWGPRGPLKVRYFSSNGRVDPNGDASIVLSQADRELGDEADMIDANGKPIDVKTVAFVLVVSSGPTTGHSDAVKRVDDLRKAWQPYVNGPATAGRGRFDTSLNPSIY